MIGNIAAWTDLLSARRRRRAIGRLVRRADAARDAGRWGEAAKAYAAALSIDAGMAGIQVQHGHALKEGGDCTGAEAAYRRAIGLRPDDPDAWLQLGHVLKRQGRARAAVEAYREALLINPMFDPAHRELIGLGARADLPEAAVSAAIEDVAFEGAAPLMTELGERINRVMALVAHPSHSYDAFRTAFPILPPSEDSGGASLAIKVDGSGQSPAAIRATLDSLLDQTHGRWSATIRVDTHVAEHPVASMAHVDDRIRFCAVWSPADGPVLLLDAGTVLEPTAVAWFLYASYRTGCAVAYCDHDHAVEVWRGRRRHLSPVLQPRFDPDWFADGFSTPAVLFVARDVPDDDRSDRATLLCELALRPGGAAHVPRLLATKLDIRTAVLDAPPDDYDVTPVNAVRPTRPAVAAPPASVAVVIPTRDQGTLLARCVETLVDRADHPQRIEIVIVDNRSQEPETATLLARLTERAAIRLLPLDEPFNWSRANNIASRLVNAERVLFVNNDTEMLTQGWDVALDGYLARDDVGLVGARLLYPDRTVQHAGIVLGHGDGAPMHEGVGAAETDPGPDGRWLRARSAGAVTGAFMAMRRSVWEAVGGFDELALPVGYNDIDMCLRVRALDLRVVYAPDIRLIHHESKTRGHNVTRTQVAWDRAELRALYTRWEDQLLDDPSINPHWARHGALFQAFREPTRREISDYLDRAAPRPPAAGR